MRDASRENIGSAGHNTTRAGTRFNLNCAVDRRNRPGDCHDDFRGNNRSVHLSFGRAGLVGTARASLDSLGDYRDTDCQQLHSRTSAWIALAELSGDCIPVVELYGRPWLCVLSRSGYCMAASSAFGYLAAVQSAFVVRLLVHGAAWVAHHYWIDRAGVAAYQNTRPRERTTIPGEDKSRCGRSVCILALLGRTLDRAVYAFAYLAPLAAHFDLCPLSDK